MNKSATVKIFVDGSAELHVITPTETDGEWDFGYEFLEPPMHIPSGDIERTLKMLIADGIEDVSVISA